MITPLLYTSIPTTTRVGDGASIPFGTVVHRCGDEIRLNGSAITIAKSGYYSIDVNISFISDVDGDVALSIMRDGQIVNGATRRITVTANTISHVSIASVVRVLSCHSNSIRVTIASSPTAPLSFCGFTTRVIKL